MTRRRLFRAIAALGIAGSAGCSDDDGPPRWPVDGMIIFDRVPLDRGSIQFQPIGGDPSRAVFVGAPIEKGLFFLNDARALPAGRYKVLVFRGVARPSAGPPEAGQSAIEETIPSRYNAETTLVAEVRPTRFNSLTYVLEK